MFTGSSVRILARMQRLRDFYQRYKQYILSDGLMYLVFVLVLVLMFVFFG